MKNYILKKSILSVALFLCLIAVEMITLSFLELRAIPSCWYIELTFLLTLALFMFIVPLGVQVVLSNIMFTLYFLLSLTNLILFNSSGRVFALKMMTLAKETETVTSMIKIPVLQTVIVGVLFIGFLVSSIIVKVKSKEEFYLKFIKKITFKASAISCVVVFVCNCLSPIISLNDKDKDRFFSSNAYIYASMESPTATLASFGIGGYYFTDFLRMCFPILKPNTDWSYAFESVNYTSVLQDKCEGDNVIFILAESFEDFAISKATTPVLYALKNGIDITEDGITNFYDIKTDEDSGEKLLQRKDFDENLVYNGANLFENYQENEVGLDLLNYKSNEQTDVSETKILTGNFELYKYAIPNLLGNIGYKTNYFHGNYGWFYQRKYRMDKFGFENILFYDNLKGKVDCSEELSLFTRDSETVSYCLENENEFDLINDEKFFTFLMTVSTHGYYGTVNEMQDKMMKDLYDKFDAYEKAYSEDYLIKLYNSSSVESVKSERRNYFAKTIDTEEMVALLINQLHEENKLKDTILVFASDHRSYSSNFVAQLKSQYLTDRFGSDYSDAEIHTVPAFIYSPKIKNSELETEGYDRKITHMTTGFDMTPTLLTLLGVSYNQDCYLGYSVINKDIKTNELLYNRVSESVTNGYYFNDDHMGILGSNLDYSKLSESKEYIDKIHEYVNNYIIHKMYIRYDL